MNSARTQVTIQLVGGTCTVEMPAQKPKAEASASKTSVAEAGTRVYVPSMPRAS